MTGIDSLPKETVPPRKRDFGYLIRIRKKRSQSAPDMEGHLELAGIRYTLAGWVKVSKRGNKFLSLSATLQQKPPSTSPKDDGR